MFIFHCVCFVFYSGIIYYLFNNDDDDGGRDTKHFQQKICYMKTKQAFKHLKEKHNV